MLRSKNYGGDTNNCSLAADDVSAGKKPKVKKMFHSNMEGKTKIDAYQSKMFLPLLLFIVLAMASTRTAEAELVQVLDGFHVYSPTHTTTNAHFQKHPTIPRRYQLTTTNNGYQGVAMWNQTPIDFTKDFMLDFSLNFGGDDFFGADGFVFVMMPEQSNPSRVFGTATNTNRAGTGSNIGYGSFCTSSDGSGIVPSIAFIYNSDSTVIDTVVIPASAYVNSTANPLCNSFAIEFDTWRNTETGFSDIAADHISYLRNGGMEAIGGNMQAIQNNYGNVEDGQDYCVRIVWEKYKPKPDVYQLSVYTVEGSPGKNMVLRHRMFFNNLSELIDGLAVDNNGHAYVTWGITSATGGGKNVQVIQYCELRNENDLEYQISGNGKIAIGLQYPNDPAINPNYTEVHTEYMYKEGGCECNDNFILPNDTVDFTNSELICYSHASYFLTVDTDLDMTNAYWQIYDYENNRWGITRYSNNGTNPFPLSDYRDKFANREDVLVRLTLRDGTKFIIKVKFKNGGILLSKAFKDHFANTPSIKINGSQGYSILTSNNLEQSIPLPPLPPGCEYQLNNVLASNFEIAPTISNNMLHFKLSPSACKKDISISRVCGDCPETFNFEFLNFNPTRAIEQTCDGPAINVRTCSQATNDFVKFELIRGGVKIAEQMGNSLFPIETTGAGSYTIKAINTITGEELNMGNAGTIIVSDSDFPPRFVQISVKVRNEPQNRCYYSIEYRPNKIPIVLSNYTVSGSIGTYKTDSEGNTNFVWRKEFQNRAAAQTIAVMGSYDCAEGPAQYKLEIMNAVTGLSCEEIISLNCTCDQCISLQGNTQVSGTVDGSTNYVAYEAGKELLVTKKNGNCTFAVKLPPGLTSDDVSIKREYQLYGTTEPTVTNPDYVSNPILDAIPSPWTGVVSGTMLNTLIYTITVAGMEDCPIRQVFKCGCQMNTDVSIDMEMAPVENGTAERSASYTIDMLTESPPPDEPIFFRVYNMNGIRMGDVHVWTPGMPLQGQFNFNIGSYPSGVYQLSAELNNMPTGTLQFIK